MKPIEKTHPEFYSNLGIMSCCDLDKKITNAECFLKRQADAYIIIENVQKHTVDKQVLKDAINKSLVDIPDVGFTINYYALMAQLKQKGIELEED